ncbi:hypothetical protein [Sphingopyxis fribergensis]
MLDKFKRPKAAYIPAGDILEIVGDGLVATASVGDGRMLPALILDTRDRADVDEYIRVHADHSAGDSRVQWAYIPDQNRAVLMLSVERPLVTKFCIGFRLDKHQGILVEQILSVNGLYLLAGRPGDRVGTTLDQSRVIIEVPDTGFRKIWDKLFLKHTAKVLREKGLPRSRSKEGAREAIALMRKTGEFRFPSG